MQLQLSNAECYLSVCACENIHIFVMANYTQSMIHLLGNGLFPLLHCKEAKKADETDKNEKYFITEK